MICNTKAKKLDQKDVIYKGVCKTCGKAYIGETAQWLDDRKGQHKRCCTKKDESNSFYCHLKENPQHEIDWDTFKVLDIEKHWKKRKLKEAVYINALTGGGSLVLNIEKGYRIDSCWNSIWSIVRKHLAEKRDPVPPSPSET